MQIMQFQNDANNHLQYSYSTVGNAGPTVDLAYLVDSRNSDDGHFMGILPTNYLDVGYPEIRLRILNAESAPDMNGIFHRVFGYYDVNFIDANIYEYGAPCLSSYEGELLAEVMTHNAMMHSSQRPDLIDMKDIVDLWIPKLRRSDLTDQDHRTPHTVNVVTQQETLTYTPMYNDRETMT